MRQRAWLIGILVALAMALPFGAIAQPRGATARAQGPALPQSGHQTEAIDLNEGKSPAELFQAGCAVCHQSVGPLAKGRREGELNGFLRQHYTSSAQHAAALANFLVANSRGGGRDVATPTRAAPVERPAASVGRRPAAEEERKPHEATRAPEREPASKRKPPAPVITARPVPTPSPAPAEPAPEAAVEASTAIAPAPAVEEEKPAGPQIPL